MIAEFVALNNRVRELEKRLAGMVRHGPVAEVNPAEGWVRLNLGEGDSGPLLSPKIPYAQMAGALKVHAPPTAGQQMTYIAPGGDPRQAIALPMTWSNQNTSPGDGADPVLTFGAVTIKLGGEWIEFGIGDFSMVISSNGVFIDGGMLIHDGLNVGSTHRHGGIFPGNSDTDVPNP